VHRDQQRTQQSSAAKYAVIAAEQPVVDQGDPGR
jgi:hypothetical protein